MVAVDLKTKVLPTGHRVYMVRPGAAYHLFGAIGESHAIAPDLAELDVPDRVRPRDFEGIGDQIKRARALADWAKTEETRSEPLPSRSAADYATVEAPARMALYRNTADTILHGLPEGSLIYVPNPDLTGEGIFGELAGANEPRVPFSGTGHYVNFRYLGRPLKNVRRLPMRKLPKAFFEPMKRRIWTHEFGSRESELIYRQYYGDFEIVGRKGVTEIKVVKEKVFAPDLSIIGAVTNLVDQSLRRIEQGERESLSLGAVVFLAPENDGPIIHANIGSQGDILVEATKRYVPRILKVIIYLSVLYTGADIFQMVIDGELSIVNSLAIPGVDAGDLQHTETLFFDFVRSTGRDNLEEIINYVRETHERTGAEVDAAIAGNR